jgi:haloacetate dehalogenase
MQPPVWRSQVDLHTSPPPPRASSKDGVEEYRWCFRDPAAIHVMCEDYRAGATLNFARDEADRQAGARIACSVLALWGGNGPLEEWYDVLAIWRAWAEDVRGRALDRGHYLAEEAPDETAAELHAFFTP